METLATEAELNNVVAYPGMVEVEEDHRVAAVRGGEESDEEETYSYMDELVMASEDNADIFGAEAQDNAEAQDDEAANGGVESGVQDAIIFEPADVEELLTGGENNDATRAAIDDTVSAQVR